MSASSVWKNWSALFDDRDEPTEPHYDPMHLGAVLVVCQVVIGVLFWLLWTLFLYEGGLPRKIGALFTRLSDRTAETHMLKNSGAFGGPGHGNVFEGWIANVVALVLVLALIAALQRLDRRHARRSR